MVYLELFHILWNLFFFTIWLEHVVTHCQAKSLKTVLRLMIFWNIIGLSMLRIIAVAGLAFLVEFRLYVVFCWNSLWYTVAAFSWFLRMVATIGIIFGQRNWTSCVSFQRFVTLIQLRKTHGRISGGHSRDFAQYCKFIQPSSMPVFCYVNDFNRPARIYTRPALALHCACRWLGP